MSACSEARPCRRNCVSASAPTSSRCLTTRPSTTSSTRPRRRHLAAEQRSSPPRSSASAPRSPPSPTRSASSRRDDRDAPLVGRNKRSALRHCGCPLLPRKRTNGTHLCMSALCQKRTFALQQIYSITSWHTNIGPIVHQFCALSRASIIFFAWQQSLLWDFSQALQDFRAAQMTSQEEKS